MDPTWQQILKSAHADEPEHASERDRRRATVFPPEGQVYRAFELTPFDAVKVVILGQDPYHGSGQANGLAFSVNPQVRIPPSLRNIFKVYEKTLHEPFPATGDLTPWAKRGVLLLNTVLTVREGEAHSHKDLGWQRVTLAAIEALNARRTGLVFILWGKPAQEYARYIDPKKHKIIMSSHPSGLSAHRGFLDSSPFVEANAYLKQPVDWHLPA